MAMQINSNSNDVVYNVYIVLVVSRLLLFYGFYKHLQHAILCLFVFFDCTPSEAHTTEKV